MSDDERRAAGPREGEVDGLAGVGKRAGVAAFLVNDALQPSRSQQARQKAPDRAAADNETLHIAYWLGWERF